MTDRAQGVVQKHGTFMDSVLEEEEGRYTGRRVRRVVLVLDCLAPHDFSNQVEDDMIPPSYLGVSVRRETWSTCSTT